MALFETKHHGKFISKELSSILLSRTTSKDRVEVFEMTGVSNFTIGAVIRRDRKLTERTAPAIVEMCRRAFKSCKKAIKDKDALISELERTGVQDLSEIEELT